MTKRFFDIHDHKGKFVACVEAVDNGIISGAKIDHSGRFYTPDLKQLRSMLSRAQAERVWRCVFYSGKSYGIIKRQGVSRTPLNHYRFEVVPLPVKVEEPA